MGVAGLPVTSATPPHRSFTVAFVAAVLVQLLKATFVVSRGIAIAVGNGSTIVNTIGATGWAPLEISFSLKVMLFTFDLPGFA
jgi:hypothetical protein